MKPDDSEPDRPDRRALIVGALIAIAGSLPIVRVVARLAPDGTIRSLLPADLESARAFGELYLDTEPSERSADVLVRKLFGGVRLASVDDRALETLRKRVRLGRDRDFRRGNLVLLDSWFLARTEARLLALAAVLLRAEP